jgi:4-hydroxybenzoate polyprenyltransferase
MLEKIVVLIKTSRPAGWLIGPIVFLAGIVFGNNTLTVLAFIQLLLLSFPYCLALYGINDIYDYESDQLNPRKDSAEGVKLDRNHHKIIKITSFFFLAILFVSSLLTLNLLNIISTILLIFFSYFYSASPLRLKERPPLDSISNGILYFLTPFLMGYSYSNTFSTTSIIKPLIITCCVIGFHAFSTIMDYSVDKKVGDTTFAVIFGKRGAAITAFFINLTAIIFSPFNSTSINLYLYFTSILYLITIFIPKEAIARLFFKLVYIGFLITSIYYFFVNINI